MAISSTNNRNDYTGTGLVSEYDFTFKIFQESDLLVTVRDTSNIEETLVLNTDYTVDGVGSVSGGSITLTTALEDDFQITIRRVVELKQNTDIRNQGDYRPQLHENQFDKLVMADQQQQDEIDRSLKLPETVSATGVNTQLPIPVAGRTIGWNDDADGLSNFANAGDLEVSGFVETVLDDSSAVVARDTLLTRGIIHVGDYDALGNGTADDAAALTSAIAAASAAGKVLYGAAGKTYRIESDVNFRNIIVDFSECAILCVGTTTKAVIGGTASQSTNPPQSFKKITRSGGVNSNPTCRIMGAKGQSIRIEECDYVDLYADTSTGNTGPDYSIAYSRFDFTKVDKVVLTNNASTPNSSVQWINENTFHLKRTTTVIVEGTYAHNHNHFYGGGFESGTITMTVGNYNVFFGVRFEGGCTVTCASGTYDNMFLATWASNENVEGFDSAPGTFTDNSGQNFCTYFHRAFQRRIPIVSVNPYNCETYSAVVGALRNNYTSIKGVDVGAYGITQAGTPKFVRSNFAIIYDSPLIPVSKGDIFTFNGDATVFRYRLKLYNSSGVQLTESSDASISSYLVCSSGLAWDDTNDNYQMSANSAEMIVNVRSSAVAFIKYDIESGSGVSSTPFSRFSLQLITRSAAASAFYNAMNSMAQTPAVSSSPVIGYSKEIGRKVSNVAGGWFTCTFTSSTTLSGAAASSATTVTVTTVTGIASGDVIGILLDSGATHWTTVNGAPSGSTVTLTVAMPSDAASGNRVVVNRWTST